MEEVRKGINTIGQGFWQSVPSEGRWDIDSFFLWLHARRFVGLWSTSFLNTAFLLRHGCFQWFDMA